MHVFLPVVYIIVKLAVSVEIFCLSSRFEKRELLLARHVFSGREAKVNKYMGGGRWVVVSTNESEGNFSWQMLA